MIDKALVEEFVEAYIQESDKDIFLVEVKVLPGNIITVEIDSKDGIDLDTCAQLNKFLESKMNRDEEDYQLEVGSSVLTAPFKHPKQYEKFLGQNVEILTRKGIKERGVLKHYDGQQLSLLIERKLRKEGDKRKKLYMEEETFVVSDIKWTKYDISF